RFSRVSINIIQVKFNAMFTIRPLQGSHIALRPPIRVSCCPNSVCYSLNRRGTAFPFAVLPPLNKMPARVSCSYTRRIIPILQDTANNLNQNSKSLINFSKPFFEFIKTCFTILMSRINEQIGLLPKHIKYLSTSLFVFGIFHQFRKLVWNYLLVRAMMADSRFKLNDGLRTTANGKSVTGKVVKTGWLDVTLETEMGGFISIPNGKLLELENLSAQEYQRLSIELGVNMLHSIKVHKEIKTYLDNLDADKTEKSKQSQVLLKKYDGEKKLMVTDIHSKLVQVISAYEVDQFKANNS
ncbi:hypothetical protein MKW98_000442, partial [Papaver atlanticum]